MDIEMDIKMDIENGKKCVKKRCYRQQVSIL